MGKAELPLHAPGTQLDRGYIGQSVPRPNAARLLQGRGTFTDDLRFPRLAHVAFFRSPYAHARIKKLDFSKAVKSEGAIAVFDGPTVAEYCTPWVAVLAHLKGIKSPPQHAIAIERACWQGEAVAAVVAESRSQAEDAAQLIEAEWEPLPVVVDMEEALEGKTIIHPEFADNVCFKREHDTGGVDEAFARADVVVEETFGFGRHTGVCLEGRAILADYNAAEHSLTVYHATQAPHMMQDIFSRHLGIPEANVRVIAKDIGGSFGIKVHVYPDEMATAAISVILRRPVKFVADRLESFVSDIHAREHRVKVRLACSKNGEILAFDLDDLTSIGPYSVYPRTSGIEGNQVVNLTGGPYKHQKYRAKMNVVFTNKNVSCQYRAVGHPIAVALTEGIVDLAANKLGMDPAEFRRKNLIADDAYPYTFPSGIKFEKLSHHKTLDLLLQTMGYEKLKKERDELRRKGIYRGIGLAAMIEVTNPSPAFYGVGGARISAQDGATLRLEPTGMLTVMCSVTEQGQGTEAIFAQIAASAVGVSIEKVRVITGDTGVTPYGGGTWASRGAGIGGEAVLLAGRALRSNMLDIAAAILKLDKGELDIANNAVINRLSMEKKLDLSELGRVAYFRPDTLPMDFQAELTVTRHYTPRQYGFTFTNGIQASLVEVDPDTGFVKLLKHWCVEDSGTLINPMLVDEQIRGGVVQGIGAALFEECLYSPDGQLLNGNMADYLVPMSGEMPDIVCAHIETPTKQSQLGAKGVGEAGTAGAPGAVMNAVNDALLPLGARVTAMPFTPERILKALGKVVCAIGIAFGILAVPAPASAQFPDKPVRLVVPVGPGGGTDLLARQLAKKLSEAWAQPVVVENRAGGAGIIGTEVVIRSTADGTTLLLSHDGVITATPILYKRPDFDPVKQLAPITQLATIPYVIAVHPSVQARNISELIALMKAKSAKKESFGFATSALGSADHLGGEQFKIAAGVDMLIVPYKSSQPAMSDVIAGHLPMGFFTIAATQPQVKAGTLRALGITSSERSKLFPDLQSVGETLPGFVSGAWYGLWAPAGTPAAIVEKVSSDVRGVVDSPDLAAYLLNNGFVAATSTPAEFAEFIKRDSAKTAQVIKSANVRIE